MSSDGDRHQLSLEDVLARFEEALRAAGAPSATRLRPGISDAEADRFGDRWPALATLYRWHDGVEPYPEQGSEEVDLCYVMSGLSCADGFWWMPAHLSVEGHARRGLAEHEWLLMDGRFEHMTCTPAGEVIVWCPEDGLQVRFSDLGSVFELAAEGWERGIFTWETAVEEEFGGFLDCDWKGLDVLVQESPGVRRLPWGD